MGKFLVKNPDRGRCRGEPICDIGVVSCCSLFACALGRGISFVDARSAPNDIKDLG